MVDGFAAHCQTTSEIADRLGLRRGGPRRVAPGPRAMGREGPPGGPRGRADPARDARRPHRQRDRGLLADGRHPVGRGDARRTTRPGIRPGARGRLRRQRAGDLRRPGHDRRLEHRDRRLRGPRPRDGRRRAAGGARDLRRLRGRQVGLVPRALAGRGRARRGGGPRGATARRRRGARRARRARLPARDDRGRRRGRGTARGRCRGSSGSGCARPPT